MHAKNKTKQSSTKKTPKISKKLSPTTSNTVNGPCNHKDLYLWHRGSISSRNEGNKEKTGTFRSVTMAAKPVGGTWSPSCSRTDARTAPPRGRTGGAADAPGTSEAGEHPPPEASTKNRTSYSIVSTSHRRRQTLTARRVLRRFMTPTPRTDPRGRPGHTRMESSRREAGEKTTRKGDRRRRDPQNQFRVRNIMDI